MIEKILKNNQAGGLGQICTECSWFNVKIGGAAVCCIKGLRKETRRQLEMEQE